MASGARGFSGCLATRFEWVSMAAAYSLSANWLLPSQKLALGPYGLSGNCTKKASKAPRAALKSPLRNMASAASKARRSAWSTVSALPSLVTSTGSKRLRRESMLLARSRCCFWVLATLLAWTSTWPRSDAISWRIESIWVCSWSCPWEICSRRESRASKSLASWSTRMRNSRMALRAPSSSNSAWAGTLVSTSRATSRARPMAAAGWVIVRLMAILPASAAGRRFRRRPSALLLLLVDDVRAAILRVGSFVAPAGARAFLTEAYRFHLLVAHAQHGERATYRLGPLLAEGEVVLAAAAIVGVALDGDPAAAIGGQVAGMRLDQRAVLVLH